MTQDHRSAVATSGGDAGGGAEGVECGGERPHTVAQTGLVGLKFQPVRATQGELGDALRRVDPVGDLTVAVHRHPGADLYRATQVH
ncbi:MAG: hypothetical protein ACRDQI_17545, partial [Pseudonocardiaceae bacterium]